MNSKQLIFLLDKNGDENEHVFVVDIANQTTMDLTPYDKVKVSLAGQHRDRPDEILVRMNKRNPQNMDIVKFNTWTGFSEIVFENQGGYLSMIKDHQWVVRCRTSYTKDGGQLVELRDSATSPWYEFKQIAMQDVMNTQPLSFSKDGKTLRFMDATGRDKSALIYMPARKGGADHPVVVFESTKADISDTYSDQETKEIQAVAVNYLRNEWFILDQAVKKDFDTVAALDHGDPHIVSQTLDNSKWIVAFEKDNGPLNYWLYNSQT